MLLVASCVFYMAFIPAYILILLITIVIDYFAGIWLERIAGPARRLLLVASIVATCAVLFVFKYFNFFIDNSSAWPECSAGQLTPPVDRHHPAHRPVVPHVPGLSYTIEVYRGRQQAERELRALRHVRDVLSAARRRSDRAAAEPAAPVPRDHDFDYARVTSGLKLMAWGLFKKLVVADRLACTSTTSTGRRRTHNGLELAVATVFFAFQIYCDFSGYSDIAIGSARVLGFSLMENFRQPVPALRRSGVLAALAHLPVDLVSRLRLHAARWQPGRLRAATMATCC